MTSIPRWTLGDRLAKARRDAHLTTYDLAKELGVSRVTVTVQNIVDRRTKSA